MVYSDKCTVTTGSRVDLVVINTETRRPMTLVAAAASQPALQLFSRDNLVTGIRRMRVEESCGRRGRGRVLHYLTFWWHTLALPYGTYHPWPPDGVP